MAKKQAGRKAKKTKKQVKPTEPKVIETPKIKPTYIPVSLQGHELFRVGKGSYYNHPNHRFRFDENGCLTGQHLNMYSTPIVWRGEIAAGHLVDVTEEYAKPSVNAQMRNDKKINEARDKAIAESVATQKVIVENKAKADAEKAEIAGKAEKDRVAAAIKKVKDQKNVSAAAVLKANAEQKSLEATAEQEAAAAAKIIKKKT